MLKTAPALVLLGASLFAASCTLFTDDNADSTPTTMSVDDVTNFQRIFMSSYWAERSGTPAGIAGKALTPFLPRAASGARATVPVAELSSTSFATLTTATALDRTLAGYPEPGQETIFTVSLVSGTPTGLKVYDVTATTTYAAGDLRKNYVEEYHVQDIGLDSGLGWNTGTAGLGTWTTADPIVTMVNGAWVVGANSILTQDQKARIRQILTFQDGTTRTETIVADSNAGGTKFDPAPFDLAGSLLLSDAFLPSPSTSPDVMYSSVVIYRVNPVTNPNFWFWQGSDDQTILGIRYYTEAQDTAAGTYTAYTASFEKTLSTLITTGGTMANTVQGVFVGSTYDVLAESVLRQRVVSDLDSSGAYPTAKTGTGKLSSNMKTRVVNITGNKDFYLTQLDSDSARLQALDTSIAIPTGAASELLAGDPSLFAYSRDQQVLPATGTLPFAILNANVAGTGAVSTVYTAIEEQTYTQATAGDLPSNLFGSTGAVATFNGQQTMGTLIPASAATVTNSMGQTGSVEAWIYISTYTNTPGIVHKGVAVDFSDECFSLQGWGDKGQMAIILDKPGTGNTYDGVYSKNDLKTKTWYYLVATWDTTLGGSSYIKLYVNGETKQGGTGKPSVSTAGYRSNTSGVLVGSQLPTLYSSSYGYFGFNGRISGANVSATPLTADEVLAKYNEYKGQTANW